MNFKAINDKKLKSALSCCLPDTPDKKNNIKKAMEHWSFQKENILIKAKNIIRKCKKGGRKTKSWFSKKSKRKSKRKTKKRGGSTEGALILEAVVGPLLGGGAIFIVCIVLIGALLTNND